MDDYSVILFYSTSSALRMEKICKGKNISITLMPVPRHLSSDCGICLRFESINTSDILSLLTLNHVEYESIREL